MSNRLPFRYWMELFPALRALGCTIDDNWRPLIIRIPDGPAISVVNVESVEWLGDNKQKFYDIVERYVKS